MASSDHLTASLIDPWILRPGASFLDPWFADAYSADTSSSSDTSLAPDVVSSFLIPTPDLNTAYFGSGSGSGSGSFEIENVLHGEDTVRGAEAPNLKQKQKQRNGGVASGQVVKRKSRATKRSQTTFIMADPSSFRQMVQQVTGSRLDNNHAINNGQIMQPEPHRPGSSNSSSSLASISECLPTLDTSALLLDRHRAQDQQHAVEMVGEGSVDPVGAFTDDLEQFGSFPNLDSWNSM